MERPTTPTRSSDLPSFAYYTGTPSPVKQSGVGLGQAPVDVDDLVDELFSSPESNNNLPLPRAQSDVRSASGTSGDEAGGKKRRRKKAEKRVSSSGQPVSGEPVPKKQKIADEAVIQINLPPGFPQGNPAAAWTASNSAYNSAWAEWQASNTSSLLRKSHEGSAAMTPEEAMAYTLSGHLTEASLRQIVMQKAKAAEAGAVLNGQDQMSTIDPTILAMSQSSSAKQKPLSKSDSGPLDKAVGGSGASSAATTPAAQNVYAPVATGNVPYPVATVGDVYKHYIMNNRPVAVQPNQNMHRTPSGNLPPSAYQQQARTGQVQSQPVQQGSSMQRASSGRTLPPYEYNPKSVTNQPQPQLQMAQHQIPQAQAAQNQRARQVPLQHVHHTQQVQQVQQSQQSQRAQPQVSQQVHARHVSHTQPIAHPPQIYETQQQAHQAQQAQLIARQQYERQELQRLQNEQTQQMRAAQRYTAALQAQGQWHSDQEQSRRGEGRPAPSPAQSPSLAPAVVTNPATVGLPALTSVRPQPTQNPAFNGVPNPHLHQQIADHQARKLQQETAAWAAWPHQAGVMQHAQALRAPNDATLRMHQQQISHGQPQPHINQPNQQNRQPANQQAVYPSQIQHKQATGAAVNPQTQSLQNQSRRAQSPVALSAIPATAVPLRTQSQALPAPIPRPPVPVPSLLPVQNAQSDQNQVRQPATAQLQKTFAPANGPVQNRPQPTVQTQQSTQAAQPAKQVEPAKEIAKPPVPVSESTPPTPSLPTMEIGSDLIPKTASPNRPKPRARKSEADNSSPTKPPSYMDLIYKKTPVKEGAVASGSPSKVQPPVEKSAAAADTDSQSARNQVPSVAPRTVNAGVTEDSSEQANPQTRRRLIPITDTVPTQSPRSKEAEKRKPTKAISSSEEASDNLVARSLAAKAADSVPAMQRGESSTQPMRGIVMGRPDSAEPPSKAVKVAQNTRKSTKALDAPAPSVLDLTGFTYKAYDPPSQPGKHTFYTRRNPNVNGPHYIGFLNTDGSAEMWPKDDEVAVDAKGQVDYTRRSAEGSELVTDWKRIIGMELADFMQLTATNKKAIWLLEDFPPGYTLYERCFGAERRPQREAVLYGSKLASPFRSPRHTLKHFAMLINNDAVCTCPECVSRVSAVSVVPPEVQVPLSQPGLRPHSTNKEEFAHSQALGFHRVDKAAPPIDVAKRLAGQVKKNKLRKQASDFDGPYVNAELDYDVRRATLKGWARLYEIVWVRIEDLHSHQTDLKLQYWPGVVLERRVETHVTAGKKMPALQEALEDEHVRVKHSHQFRVALLASATSVWRTEGNMAPFLSYRPSQEIMSMNFRNAKYLNTIWDSETERSSFTAIDAFKHLESAAPALALALQMASHMISYYCTVDKFIVLQVPEELRKKRRTSDNDSVFLQLGVKVIHYQHIYLGAERIWVGDMVRLCLRRSEDLPMPAGSAPIRNIENRCLNLLVNSIYRHQTTDVLTMSGSVYEMFDMDESEDADAPPVLPQDVRMFPTAPAGYALRLVTPVTQEHHISLDFIAGRLYSAEALHPALSNQNDDPDDKTSPVSLCKALCGVLPGSSLFMAIKEQVENRRQALIKGQKAAEDRMIKVLLPPVE